MLGSLKAIVDSPEFGEHGFATAVTVVRRNSDAVIDLRVDEGRGPPESPNWRVTCVSVWDIRIDDDARDIVVYAPDHPALRQYTDSQATLFFNGTPGDPFGVIGELLATHAMVCNRWIPFHRYLNDMPLQRLLEGGFGKLASGPAFLIQNYAEVLNSHSMSPSIVHGGRRKRWHDGQFQDAPDSLALVQLGEYFIVAEGFRAERIENWAA